jgi:hypothetical protein
VRDPSDLAAKWRSANRLAMGVGVLALAAAGAFLYFGWKDVREARRGPTPLTAEQLEAAPAVGALPAAWVTVTPTGVKDSGVRRDLSTRYGARRPTLQYALARLDGRYLIVETLSAPKAGSPLTGTLHDWRGDDVVSDVLARTPALRNKLLPFYLSTREKEGGASRALWAGAGGSALVGVGLVAGGLIRLLKELASAREAEEWLAPPEPPPYQRWPDSW